MAGMKLFVGLGNPGREYAGQRHNVGFMAIEEIAQRHSFSAWRKRFQGEVSEGLLDGIKVLLIKPQTYMNESGRSVGQAMQFFKLNPDDVYVFHDELDLIPGKLKVKTGGGAAGHNGLRSIVQQIGADFHRVRIGIGHPGHKDRVHGYVLRNFAKADQEWLGPLLEELGRAASHLANGDAARFMTEIARNRTDRHPLASEKTDASKFKPREQQHERKHAKWDVADKLSRGDQPQGGNAFDKLKSLFSKSNSQNGEK